MPKFKKDAKEFDQKVYFDGTAYRMTVPKVWVERVKNDKLVSIGTFTFDGETIKIRIANEK